MGARGNERLEADKALPLTAEDLETVLESEVVVGVALWIGPREDVDLFEELNLMEPKSPCSPSLYPP
jgi:hypothetical protein